MQPIPPLWPAWSTCRDVGQGDVVAKSIAASNGYTSNVNVGEVYQNGVPSAADELQVTITDSDIPTFFAKVFGLDSIKETETSIAEFQQPMPLGSAENSFGTGNLPWLGPRCNLREPGQRLAGHQWVLHGPGER